MSIATRAMVLAAAGLYLASAALPCPPAAIGETQNVSSAEASVSVLCPCHLGDSAASGVVGADWHGPRSAAANPPAAPRAVSLFAEPRLTQGRGVDPPSPIPIV